MDLITIVTVIDIKTEQTKDDMSEILTPKVDAAECMIEGDAFVTDFVCLESVRP